VGLSFPNSVATPGTIRRQVENAIDSLVSQESTSVLPAVPNIFTARPLNAAAIKEAFNLATATSGSTNGETSTWSAGL